MKLNEIFKAGKVEEVKKGEWRAIDGYVVMAVEICMVSWSFLWFEMAHGDPFVVFSKFCSSMSR